MHITSDAGVNAILDGLLSQMRETIGAKLVGLYLYGSAVTGEFDREISDIDLLAATSSDIDDGEFSALQRLHTKFTGEHKTWADRLDIGYVSVTALGTFRTRTSTIAVISPGEPFHRLEAGRDWLMNWYLVREHSLTLFGPPPGTFIRPISKEEFIQAVREHTKGWSEWMHRMRKRKSQAYAVLTMCRALYAHENGEHSSKHQAALWAERELPQWSSLIQEARRWRSAWRDDDVDDAATFPETLRFVQFVIHRIATE
jgi:predicted nucleotidyltransferase